MIQMTVDCLTIAVTIIWKSSQRFIVQCCRPQCYLNPRSVHGKSQWRYAAIEGRFSALLPPDWNHRTLWYPLFLHGGLPRTGHHLWLHWQSILSMYCLFWCWTKIIYERLQIPVCQLAQLWINQYRWLNCCSYRGSSKRKDSVSLVEYRKENR